MSPNTKVFDVTPPGAGEPFSPKKEEPDVPEKSTEPIEEKPRPRKRIGFKISPKKTSLITIASLIAIIILGWLFIKPKASLNVWPQQQQAQYSKDVVVYAGSQATGDIPGQILQVSKSVSGNFNASSTQMETVKASGTISVYNEYSTSAQTLLNNTRFVSSDGKLFRSQKSVVIPGATYKGGDMVPGVVDVPVLADQPGDSYNIGPSTFSLPGLAGTASYTSIYGKSASPMAGGISKQVPVVTQSDIDNAKAQLTQDALSQSKTALQGELPSGQDYVILDNAIQQNITNFSASQKVGDQVSSFSAQADSQAQAMVFKKSDVQQFAQKYIAGQIPQGKALQDSSLQVQYTVDSVALDKGTIDLTLNITGTIYSTIDQATLKKAVVDKTPSEINTILKGYPQITKAEVNLWPFWVKKAPSDVNKIDINLRLD